MAEAIAPIMGQKAYMINCSQWTSPIQIIGGQTIDGYVEGQLIKAWAEGGILILDELPKLDPNTAGLLNDALAKSDRQPKYDEKGKIDPDTIPEITNGAGKTIKKGQDQPEESLKYRFAVIATGNTNMMDVGNKYSGNQRQDYSLVDRFAGSIYQLDINEETEKRTIYPYVFEVCSVLRDFLNAKDALQSVSLRTMLNFNRTFEQEMLYKCVTMDKEGNKMISPFADEIFTNEGMRVAPKSVQDSINSFLNMLEKNLRRELVDNDPVNAFAPRFKEKRDAVPSLEKFKVEFKLRYHLDPMKPIDQKPLTKEELDKVYEEAKKINSNLSFLGGDS
jgi:cobaltochelatase CobS